MLLVLVDLDDVERPLLDIQRMAIACATTVMCAFSHAEVARYLETFKAYENKPATAIQERVGGAYLPQVTEVLTTIRSVNRTDVLTLLSTFGSLAGVCAASMEELGKCPGFGEKKVKRVWTALHGPLNAGVKIGPSSLHIDGAAAARDAPAKEAAEPLLPAAPPPLPAPPDAAAGAVVAAPGADRGGAPSPAP